MLIRHTKHSTHTQITLVTEQLYITRLHLYTTHSRFVKSRSVLRALVRNPRAFLIMSSIDGKIITVNKWHGMWCDVMWFDVWRVMRYVMWCVVFWCDVQCDKHVTATTHLGHSPPNTRNSSICRMGDVPWIHGAMMRHYYVKTTSRRRFDVIMLL